MEKELIKKCKWILANSDYCYYTTSCDKAMALNVIGIKNNEFKFCPFCGKEIKEDKLK